jgi:lysophospholipase L1-like esterase
VTACLLASCSKTPAAPSRTPQLNATRFVAFGDSITAGVLATSCPIGGGVNCAAPAPTPMGVMRRKYELQGLFTGLEASPSSYPRLLESLLAARYTTQTPSISNEGVPGEFVADGRTRLPATLAASPQVLLLQEGANDMNQPGPQVDTLVDDLRAMVREGRARGMIVIVGTLLPQRPNACRGYDFCDGRNDTIVTNAKIRAMAATEGATLVDLYPAFDGKTDTLLGLDGLHPNEAGYQKMADLFFEGIRQRLELP